MQVSDMMTRDPLTLPPEATVAAALAATSDRDVHHLLVTRDGRLVGIACVCDLRKRPPDEPLDDHFTGKPHCIDAGRSLKEAAETFVAAGVSCLPVCEGERLVGVLTRGDVHRVKSAKDVLPGTFACTYCGSTRHVRPLRGSEALAACMECADRAEPAREGHFDEGRGD